MGDFNQHTLDGCTFTTMNNSVKDLLDTNDNNDLRFCSEIPDYEKIFETSYENGLLLATHLIIDLFQLVAKDLIYSFGQFNFPVAKDIGLGWWGLNVITKDVEFDIERGNKKNVFQLQMSHFQNYFYKTRKISVFKPCHSLFKIVDENAKKRIYYLTETRNPF